MVALVPSEQIRTAGAAELVALDPADLALNRSDDRFWFHYTDPGAALAITTAGIYEVGDRHPKAPGLYVSTVQPGRSVLKICSTPCSTVPETSTAPQAAVVFADGPLTFERVSEHAWRFRGHHNR
jgi:hypothetical protein